jgi:hypothetical protein
MKATSLAQVQSGASAGRRQTQRDRPWPASPSAKKSEFSDMQCRSLLTDYQRAFDTGLRFVSACCCSITNLSRATMETIYLGIGTALYLVFAAWCILAPQN